MSLAEAAVTIQNSAALLYTTSALLYTTSAPGARIMFRILD